jgi:GDP-L-fucose synthase
MTEYKSAVTLEEFHPETVAFFKKRRVLVLGGSGFIGSHVVEQLQVLGAAPVVLSRKAKPAFLAHLSDVEIIVGALERSETVDAAASGCSVILNLAASVAGVEYNASHPATMFMDNMGIFFPAIRAAVQARVDRFLVTSSACVYPRYCTIPTPESEGFLDSPEPTNEGYGWAKRMEEFVGAAAAREYGLSVAIARPYNAYGPRDNFSLEKSHVLAALVRKAVEAKEGTFGVWGDGSHSRGFLYVDDFARGIIEVAARFPKAEPINIGAHEETTIREAAETVASEVSNLTGRTVQPVFEPKGVTGQPRRACDTTKARELLGYHARVPFREGVRRTIQWYLQQ